MRSIQIVFVFIMSLLPISVLANPLNTTALYHMQQYQETKLVEHLWMSNSLCIAILMSISHVHDELKLEDPIKKADASVVTLLQAGTKLDKKYFDQLGLSEQRRESERQAVNKALADIFGTLNTWMLDNYKRTGILYQNSQTLKDDVDMCIEAAVNISLATD